MVAVSNHQRCLVVLIALAVLIPMTCGLLGRSDLAPVASDTEDNGRGGLVSLLLAPFLPQEDKTPLNVNSRADVNDVIFDINLKKLEADEDHLEKEEQQLRHHHLLKGSSGGEDRRVLFRGPDADVRDGDRPIAGLGYEEERNVKEEGSHGNLEKVRARKRNLMHAHTFMLPLSRILQYTNAISISSLLPRRPFSVHLTTVP